MKKAATIPPKLQPNTKKEDILAIKLISLRPPRKKGKINPWTFHLIKNFSQSGCRLAYLFQTHLEICFPDWWVLSCSWGKRRSDWSPAQRCV